MYVLHHQRHYRVEPVFSRWVSTFDQIGAIFLYAVCFRSVSICRVCFVYLFVVQPNCACLTNALTRAHKVGAVC